ncbi:MAG TPA: UpxY family transcription antiterminator [Puia sp.]|jgi:transcription antitermination factor NusG|nr:UpxY family transcription antiterminator [Puia sp.]
MIQKEKQWYVLYTKPRWEKKVSRQLEQKRIEYYCPLNKIQRQWSDRKKIIEEPLFSCYVFVRLSETEHLAARMIDGVMNFVFWLRKPAVVRQDEIEAIKRFTNEYTDVKLEKKPVNLNDTVRIINGPLMQREGNVLEIRKKTVKLSLPSLGYLMVAEVGNTNVEIISMSGQYYKVSG